MVRARDNIEMAVFVPPTCPFTESTELVHVGDDYTVFHNSTSNPSKLSIPGQPRIKLRDRDQTTTYLLNDLYCEKLARMAPRLWVLSTHSHSNITPLHRQRLRGRTPIVMEDPAFHLVWNHDRIFIKPLPRYLLTYSFWKNVLLETGARADLPEAHILPAARGLLRSYFYLIQRESDFRVAQREDLQLIPGDVTFEQFCAFSETFGEIPDSDVAERYEYGELRLTRLNAWALPLLGTTAYQHVGLQYIDDFSPYFTPLLFVFAVVAILLNAMQVGLAAVQIDGVPWAEFVCFSRWFAIASIVFACVPCAGLLVLLMYKIGDEWVYALRQRWKRSREKKATTVEEEEP